MKLWTQNDKNLNPIQEWGCYYISIVNMVSIATNVDFSASEVIIKWFKNYKDDGDIDIESTILDPDGIIEDFCGKNKVIFVGKRDANYVCNNDEYEILDYFNKRTGYTHFVLGDGKGKCMIDPFPGSRTVREGDVRSKRIYKKVV